MVPLNPTFFMRVQTLFAVPLGTRPQLAEIAVTNNAKKKRGHTTAGSHPYDSFCAQRELHPGVSRKR